MTNVGAYITGCWDPFHEGHVHILKEAAKLGPLVVACMGDDYIKNVKMRQPTCSIMDRANKIKAALPDHPLFVISCQDNDEVLRHCEGCNLEYRVVGDDYAFNDVIRNKEAKVVIVPGRVGRDGKKLVDLSVN